MQTEAEKYLITILKTIVTKAQYHIKMINLGAAKSTVIETAILTDSSETESQYFICDRVDIQDCHVDNNYVKQTYIGPLEDLSAIPDLSYEAAFANFVLEHINDPYKAAKEMARILKPGGHLVLSMSNPSAPEFIVARFTPTRFHQLFRHADHDEAYPVEYSYKNIANFIDIMIRAGWSLKEEKRFPAIYSYLHRFVFINMLSKVYDNFISFFGLKFLHGHVVLHFIKMDHK